MAGPRDIDDGRYLEGAEKAEDRLLVWLNKFATDEDIEEGFKIGLYRDYKGGELDVGIYQYSIGGGETVEEIVSQIMEDATESAFKYRGRTNYIVKIQGKPKHKLTFPLRVPTEFEGGLSSFDDFDEEMPTAKGIVGQTMRHSEVFAKEMVKSATGNQNMLQDIIRDQRDEIMRLRQHQIESIKVFEELNSMKWARDMEIKEREDGNRMKEEGLKVLKQVGDVVAMKFLGPGVMQGPDGHPTQPTPFEKLVENFFSSLQSKPEKMQRIAEVLEPMDLYTISEIAKAIEERKKREKEMEDAATQANRPSPPSPGGFASPQTPGGGPGGFNQPRPNPNPFMPFGANGQPFTGR